MFKSFVASGLALIALSMPAAASQVGYKCQIDDIRSNQGWLPKVLFIGHNEATDAVTASDPIILHFNDRQPVQGKVAINNDKRITFTWRIDTKSRSNQRTKIRYRATYIRATGTMQLNARPSGYRNVYQAGGTCEVGPVK